MLFLSLVQLIPPVSKFNDIPIEKNKRNLSFEKLLAIAIIVQVILVYRVYLVSKFKLKT